jgi:hypothetical protein
MTNCKHEAFAATCNIARLEDTGGFMFEATVKCTQCKKPFQFLGVAAGLNLAGGATVSIDGLKLNCAICPQEAKPAPIHGLLGYDIKKGFQ